MMEQFRNYRVRLAIRPTFKGRPARPGAEAFNGTEIVVTVAWWQGDDDLYPGEYALARVDGDPILPGMSWISSGDVEVIDIC